MYGNVTKSPFGGKTETIGFNSGPAWASVTQQTNPAGIVAPRTVQGGVNLSTPNGTGLTGNVLHTQGAGGSASVTAVANVVHTPQAKVDVWAQHNRMLNKQFHTVGPATNSAGVNVNHQSGLNASGSVSQTHGFPAVNTVGVGVPLHNSNNSSLNLTGSSSFGKGMRRNNGIGLNFHGRF